MSNSSLGNLFTYKTLVHAVAGATGSVIAMGTFYPLDTVRSRLQLEDREAKNSLAVMKDLIQEEGFGTLYRGMVPVLESLCCSNFVYFYTFHGLKAVRAKPAEQNAGRDLMLAALAGVVNVVVTTPLWVVNTRLKMKGVSHGNQAPDTVQAVPFTGLLDGLCHVASTEGLGALWRGTLPSLLLVSNPSLQFMAYEAIKRRLLAGRPAPAELGSLAVFLVGAAAKAFATVTTYPLQLVQTKLRHGHNYPNLSKDANMFQLTLYIIKLSGVKGLFKGMEAKILQTILTAALMFVAYEKIVGLVFQLLRANKSV